MHCTELKKPHLIDYDMNTSFFLLLVVALPNL